MMDAGVQTFTIRAAQRRSTENAYLPLIKLGIRKLEISRMDFSEKNAIAVRALVDKYGIEVASLQVKPKEVFGDPERIIKFCKITGCTRVVISMLPFKCILGSEKRFFEFLSTLDPQCDLYAEHGITLAYHHHNWEYVTLSSGKMRMDELLDRTSKLKFVHDTYWTAKCGIDPTVQIERFGARLLGVHLRDLALYKKGLDVRARDAALGDGVLDFAKIATAAERVGAEYLVIEQKTDTPYSDIEKSYTYFKSLTEVSK